MNWMPIYALLIFVSTATTFGCSILMERNQERKRLFLVLSLVFNLGILFVFKYFNFINESLFQLLTQAGLRWQVPNLDLLLPVGISFYTFQAVGYTIDVYRGRLAAERHFGRYALFVSFFPQLVAGPIERASNLLPQFYQKQQFQFQRFLDGSRQMLWGFFMKVCIADRLALYVDAVYGNVDKHGGSTFWLATTLFAIQIYCDFAGYSNIAIGAARIMGFDLMENFNRPYFARSVREFWSRWHISLSTWFRDYVYIPLGGNRVNLIRHLSNLFITFLVSGIWHGANWTFVLWGGLHGIFLIVELLAKRLIKFPAISQKWVQQLTNLLAIAFTFFLVNLSWVFFRADDIQQATTIVSKLFSQFGPIFLDKTALLYGSVCITLLFIKEVKDELRIDFHLLSSPNLYVRGLSYALMIYMIVLFGVVDSSQFIYFQF
ncbi:MAG: MBOAT family O-acyltransferase [Bacteroidota bacterium]